MSKATSEEDALEGAAAMASTVYRAAAALVDTYDVYDAVPGGVMLSSIWEQVEALRAAITTDEDRSEEIIGIEP